VPHNDEAFQVFLDEINQLGQNDIHMGSQMVIDNNSSTIEEMIHSLDRQENDGSIAFRNATFEYNDLFAIIFL